MKEVTSLSLLIIAFFAFLLGLSVYMFDRPGSIYFIEPVALPFATQALPSFFHTLGFALLSALVIGRRRLALLAISAWGLLAFIAELLQQQHIPLRGILAIYQNNSTYDYADLLAIILATLLALLLVFPELKKQSR